MPQVCVNTYACDKYLLALQVTWDGLSELKVDLQLVAESLIVLISLVYLANYLQVPRAFQ